MFFPLDADKLALKIAEDIDLGTSVLPRIAGLEEAFSPLREIFIKSYKEMVAGGNKYWEQYLKDVDGLGYSRMEELVTAAYKATYNK